MRTSISFSLGSKRGSASVTSVHNYAIAIQKARDFRNPTSKITTQDPSQSHDFKTGAKGLIVVSFAELNMFVEVLFTIKGTFRFVCFTGYQSFVF